MKSYLFSLRVLTWLIVLVVTVGLACQPETDITEAAPAVSEGPAETITDSSAGTKAPVETTAQSPAAVKPPVITEAPAKAAAKPDEIGIAVTVNGVDITESQIEAKIRPQLERIATRLPPQAVEQYKQQLRQKALETTIIEQLLNEKVKEANVIVTDEEVNSHIEKMASQQNLSVEDLKELIKASGRTFEQWKEQMQFPKRLGYQKFMKTQWEGKISVTEDDVQKYYSENTKQFETPEQVRASHILIKPDTTDSNIDPNEAKAQAKVRAKDLLEQVRDGADFATLARANSGCPSAAKGGDLNFFGRGRMTPAFEKVAFKLKVGQVSDVVETQFGYHIIKVTDRKDAGAITFEQAKDDILKVLMRKKQSEVAMRYIELLKAGANVVYPAGKEPDTGKVIPMPIQ